MFEVFSPPKGRGRRDSTINRDLTIVKARVLGLLRLEKGGLLDE